MQPYMCIYIIYVVIKKYIYSLTFGETLRMKHFLHVAPTWLRKELEGPGAMYKLGVAPGGL